MKFPGVVAVLCVVSSGLASHRDNLMHLSPLDRKCQRKMAMLKYCLFTFSVQVSNNNCGLKGKALQRVSH